MKGEAHRRFFDQENRLVQDDNKNQEIIAWFVVRVVIYEPVFIENF